MPPVYDEPIWLTSEDRVAELSHFYERPLSALSVTALLVRLLQSHFASADTISDRNLRHLTWSADAASRKLTVAAGFNDQPRQGITAPALYINRGECSIEDPGIPPHLLQLSVNGQGLNAQYTRLQKGTHTIICESRTGMEAEALAEEVYRRLIIMLDLIRDEMRFNVLTVAGCGNLTPSGEGEAKAFRVPIPVQWVVMYQYSIKEETAW